MFLSQCGDCYVPFVVHFLSPIVHSGGCAKTDMMDKRRRPTTIIDAGEPVSGRRHTGAASPSLRLLVKSDRCDRTDQPIHNATRQCTTKING